MTEFTTPYLRDRPSAPTDPPCPRVAADETIGGTPPPDVVQENRPVPVRPVAPPTVATTGLFIRLAVKPGMTGLWQVSGRSDLTWAETMQFDVHYVDNWSLGLDLQILFRTIRALLGHRGAY